MENTTKLIILAVVIIVFYLLIGSNITENFYTDYYPENSGPYDYFTNNDQPFLTRYDTVDRKPVMSRVLFNLVFISELLKKYNIRHWLMFSSLADPLTIGNLGNNTFSMGAYTDDMDRIIACNVPIFKDDYKINVETKLNINGDLVPDKYKLNVTYKNIIVGMIYLFERMPDHTMRCCYTDNCKLKCPFDIPRWFTDQLILIKIDKYHFPSPREPELLLKYWYGSNWQEEAIKKMRNNSYKMNVIRDITVFDLCNYIEQKYGIIIDPNRNVYGV